MIDLYFAPTSNGLRASVALEETGLPYTLHNVDIYGGEQHQPAFRAINPAGLIPVIVDSDGPDGKPLTLNQSGAIVLYCAEKSGKFIPRHQAARALAMQWVLQAASDVSGASMTIFRLENSAPEKSAVNADYFRTRLRDAFRACDHALATHDFLAGELSVADLILYPTFASRRAVIEGIDGFDNIKRWADRMAARPGVQRGMQYAK